jgi:hypothetical protein
LRPSLVGGRYYFGRRGLKCGQTAGQLTGDEFDGLLLEGGTEVLVALQLLRPVAGHLADDRVRHTLDEEHGGGEVAQVVDAKVVDFGKITNSPEPLA